MEGFHRALRTYSFSCIMARMDTQRTGWKSNLSANNDFELFFHFNRLDPKTRQCTENHVYPRFLSQSKRRCVRNVTVQEDTLSKSDCNTVCLLHVCTLYIALYSNPCSQTCEYIAVPVSLDYKHAGSKDHMKRC